jgi:ubiquinone/menaquinone biosynthesis C-methylase UbiE
MGSIAFDQAAEYYDRTRQLAPETQAAVIALLARELGGRPGRCLEIGIGTGRMALDLHAAGVPMAGVDLARPMLDQLVRKAGGTLPFPLAVADATALPFAADAFTSAMICQVLHLVPNWRTAVEELVRVVRPGGLILADIGGDGAGMGREINRYFFAQTRLQTSVRLGLTDFAQLEQVLADHRYRPRPLQPIVRRIQPRVGQIIQSLEDGIQSRCWTLDDSERRVAAAATREWALERWGSLDATEQVEVAIVWRAYDAPGD